MSPRPFRWVRPEVSPLFVSIALAVGICGYSLARNLMTNPAVYVRKDRRGDFDIESSDGEHSYGRSGLLRNFGHVHGKPDAWKGWEGMEARQEKAAAKV